ncbi:MAG TPA: T9SS type A sorting domain-containing protein, partial [Ferruginibacter sp.]|nr:T9SS type A sorting domain-containing protein [Ferruginibacter sp.]
LRSYFNWVMKQSPTSKQYIITGTLHRDLPAKFAGKIAFMLMPNKAGTSTLVCQLLLSNDRNTSSVLSDQAPTNNYLSMSYTNVKPLDIKFIRFDAASKACMVDLNWAIYDETKQAKQFVVETSANGSTFTPVQTIPAGQAIAYSQVLDKLQSQDLAVRIKVEAANGQYIYSDEKSAKVNCSQATEIFLYPNPVSAEVAELTLRAKNGVFNGRYEIRITDASGAEVKKLEATYTNEAQVKLKTGKLAAGIYTLILTGEDGQPVTVKMVRL